MNIDWARIARPQVDGYDTEVALALACANGLAGFARMRAPSSAPTRVLFDGRVQIRHVHDPSPWTDLVNAPIDAPVIAEAETKLRLWPEIHAQFAALIDSIQPVTAVDAPTEGHYQSCSGSSEREFGLIYATVEHGTTMAEALVHELAHAKLHALGVGVERAARLIVNDPARRYESPVIRARPRPMTAVFHAQYTFTHILELDLRLLANDDGAERSLLLDLLAYTLVRVEHGLALVRRDVELDDAGSMFMAGYCEWADELIDRAHARLREHGHAGAELPPVAYQVEASVTSTPKPSPTPMPKRLNFRLHEFLRVSWVSAAAQQAWSDRLDAARVALARLGDEILGDPGCSWKVRLEYVYPFRVDELIVGYRERGLATARLNLDADRVSELDARRHVHDDRKVFLLVGDEAAVEAAREAGRARDSAAWHRAFGRPPCCVAAAEQARRAGLDDPTWPLLLGADGRGLACAEVGTIAHAGRWQTQPLLARLGLSPLPYTPCSPDCVASIALAEASVARGRALGLDAVFDDLVELLSWPVSWSSLHGIAELRTPLFKAIWDSDAIAERVELRLLAQRWPAEAPTGLGFPYRPPRKHFFSDTARFQAGLANIGERVVSLRRPAIRLALVGPRGIGKSTQAEVLAARLGCARYSVDAHAAALYRADPLFAAAASEFDDDAELMPIFASLRAKLGREFFAHQERLHLLAVEQLAAAKLDAVVDFGVGHTCYSDPALLERARERFAGLPAVCLWPAEEPQRAVALLARRSPGVDPELLAYELRCDHARAFARTTLIVGDDPPEQVTARLLAYCTRA